MFYGAKIRDFPEKWFDLKNMCNFAENKPNDE
jgi:hypothetical protein